MILLIITQEAQFVSQVQEAQIEISTENSESKEEYLWHQTKKTEAKAIASAISTHPFAIQQSFSVSTSTRKLSRKLHLLNRALLI
jgi:hypothetical protein